MSQAVKESAIPPRRGKVIAITLDNTAREYDLNNLELGGYAPTYHPGTSKKVCLRFEAIGAAVYLYFAPETNGVTLSAAALIAAGGALVPATTMPGIIPSGQYRDYEIDRSIDRFLTYAGSGAGSLRIHAVSETL